MYPDLNGKIVIVTGGAQGIGKSIVEKFLANGSRVILADRNEEQGRATVDALGGQVQFIPCDVTQSASVFDLIAAAVKTHGRLDIMVNNAGINSNRPQDRVTAEQYPIETWKKIIDVDLNGTFYGCQAAAQQMVAQGQGAIVNIASVAGMVALRLQIGYVAAKAAIIRITEAMACELGPKGIRVNCVSPGSTLTDGTRELFYHDKDRAAHVLSFIPQRRPGETAEIADGVVFLASDAASYVNGHNLAVDGGWTCGFTRDF